MSRLGPNGREIRWLQSIGVTAYLRRIRCAGDITLVPGDVHLPRPTHRVCRDRPLDDRIVSGDGHLSSYGVGDLKGPVEINRRRKVVRGCKHCGFRDQQLYHRTSTTIKEQRINPSSQRHGRLHELRLHQRRRSGVQELWPFALGIPPNRSCGHPSDHA